jgi:hypothetical protein
MLFQNVLLALYYPGFSGVTQEFNLFSITLISLLYKQQGTALFPISCFFTLPIKSYVYLTFC